MIDQHIFVIIGNNHCGILLTGFVPPVLASSRMLCLSAYEK